MQTATKTIVGANILGILALVAASCSNDADNCELTETCGASASGGKAGGGTGGASGTSGRGGGSGKGGSEGGGTTGNGGGGGSEAGGSGVAGSAASGGSGGSEGGGSGSSGVAGSDGGAGVGGEDGGMGGAGGGGETPCEDPTATPGEDACVIDEEYGVFVSPGGNDDTGLGTRALPYATIGKAIEAAVAAGLRIYACADGGAYAESVTIGAGASGLEMYGGFSCDDWSYSTTAKSLVSTTGQLALRVEGVEALRVEDFGFQAADALEAGGSSVGGFVLNSTGVVLRRVRLSAGKGMGGADGVTGHVEPPDPLDLKGFDANGEVGGKGCQITCPSGGMTSGGRGGSAGVPGQAGTDGTPDWGGGKGGAVGTCNVDAQRGGNAPAQASSPGAAAIGMLSPSGWMSASGGNGAVGHPGQGGGGGASTVTEGGGGGGCGGCGGGGGLGGQGGGGSIGLMVFQSEVAIEDSEVAAAGGGDAGDGVAGQDGTSGGDRGSSENACDGGAGGLGGKGGASGGGAGGISVGVLWNGEVGPSIGGTEYMLGTPGAKGIGGEPGVNDGIDGVAEEVLEVT